MGGHAYSTDDNPKQLLTHKNFKVPEVPKFLNTKQDSKSMAIVDYCTEFIANFLSPKPKLPDEDNVFSCNDLAKTVRKDLNAMIKSELVKAKRD